MRIPRRTHLLIHRVKVCNHNVNDASCKTAEHYHVEKYNEKNPKIFAMI